MPYASPLPGRGGLARKVLQMKQSDLDYAQAVAVKVRDLDKGELVSLRPQHWRENVRSASVWVYHGYDKHSRKHVLVKFDDISWEKLLPGDSLVFEDFVF